MPFGAYCIKLMTDLQYFSTMLPRIPVAMERLLKVELVLHGEMVARGRRGSGSTGGRSHARLPIFAPSAWCMHRPNPEHQHLCAVGAGAKIRQTWQKSWTRLGVPSGCRPSG